MDEQRLLLRNIGLRMGVSPLKQAALQPGMTGVYRLTIHYADARAHDSIATLARVGLGRIAGEFVYLGKFAHKPIQREFSLSVYEQMADGLQRLHFDQLNDQPDVPFYGVDLWLVERAAGSFSKSIVVAPATASGVHLQLVDTLRRLFPDAVRTVPRNGEIVSTDA
jgi:hypothetical protein